MPGYCSDPLFISRVVVVAQYAIVFSLLGSKVEVPRLIIIWYVYLYLYHEFYLKKYRTI